MPPPSRSTMMFERFVTDDGTIVMFVIILCYGMYSVGSLLKKYLVSWSLSLTLSAASRATTKNNKNKKSPKMSKSSSIVTNTNEGKHEQEDPKTATGTTPPTVTHRNSNSSRPPHQDETADLSVEELDLIARLAGNYPHGTLTTDARPPLTTNTASTPTPITPSRLQRPSLLSAMKDPAGTKYALKHNLAYEDTMDDGVESSDAE